MGPGIGQIGLLLPDTAAAEPEEASNRAVTQDWAPIPDGGAPVVARPGQNVGAGPRSVAAVLAEFQFVVGEPTVRLVRVI